MRRLHSLLFTLWTVLAMLAAHATPAFAFAPVAGRSGVESAAASPTGDREAVSSGSSPRGTPDARVIKRSPRASQHAPPATAWSTPATTQRLVFATPRGDILVPTTWSGWETAARARARLMVFLN